MADATNRVYLTIFSSQSFISKGANGSEIMYNTTKMVSGKKCEKCDSKQSFVTERHGIIVCWKFDLYTYIVICLTVNLATQFGEVDENSWSSRFWTKWDMFWARCIHFHCHHADAQFHTERAKNDGLAAHENNTNNFFSLLFPHWL